MLAPPFWPKLPRSSAFPPGGRSLHNDIGFISRPNDTPYLEESFAIEWNTLKHWDVPYAHAINVIAWL